MPVRIEFEHATEGLIRIRIENHLAGIRSQDLLHLARKNATSIRELVVRTGKTVRFVEHYGCLVYLGSKF
jgi:hypothetical protein